MWSYYGSKSKIVDCYPPPKYDKIIEPFAGSARYALKYWDRDVLLVDKYETVVNLWKWLQNQTPNDILGLPNMDKGQDLRLIDMPKEAKALIGFCINQGSSTPKNMVGGFNGWNNAKKQIAKELHKIKHWEIRQGCYTDLQNEKATWFIDPPYQFGGEYYKESSKNLTFEKLGEWCKTRNGHVIVCENTKADWMDFKEINFFKHANNMGNEKTTEAIWTNFPTQYDSVQQELFSWAGGK